MRKITKGRETRKESKHEIGGTIAHEHELTKNHVARNATESDGADDPEKPKSGDCFNGYFMLARSGECCNTCVKPCIRSISAPRAGISVPVSGIPQCEKEGITSAMLMGGDRIGAPSSRPTSTRRRADASSQASLASQQSLATSTSMHEGEALSKAERAQHHRARIAHVCTVQYLVTACAPSPSATTAKEMAVIDSSEAEGKERNLTSQLDGAERIISDGWYVHVSVLLEGRADDLQAIRGQSREIFQYSVTEHMRHVTPGSGRGQARRLLLLRDVATLRGRSRKLDEAGCRF